MSNSPKYPDIKIKLAGQDGNAFAILSRCVEAMRKAKINREERDKFVKEATSGNYDHLLIVCMDWFEIE